MTQITNYADNLPGTDDTYDFGSTAKRFQNLYLSGDVLDDSGDIKYLHIDQTTPQTVGDTTDRLTKLWVDDITVTNAIAGDITGNAATVTNGVYTTDFPLNQNTTGKADTAGNADTVTNGIYTTDFPLNQNTTGNAATVTTNANLTGVITSVGNATSIAS